MNKHKYKKNFITFKPNFYFWDKFSMLDSFGVPKSISIYLARKKG